MIRALFVDDDPDLRTITAVALRLDAEFAVETTGSASGALALLRVDGGRFDVILLGTTTSDMDRALIEAIRWLPACRETSVVFLASRAADDDRLRYRAMGAAGIIAVPFDPLTLSRQIAGLLQPVRNSP